PLDGTSPVVTELNRQLTQLLSTDCANPISVLLETITLTDAIICTLGSVERTGQMQDLETGSLMINPAVDIPYSQLSDLIKGLTTSGSGNYLFVLEMRRMKPEIFKDYRVRYAMVQALGVSFSDLANLVQKWLLDEDDSIILWLKEKFDPRGRKEMVRRLRVIGAIAGERENNFYLAMLEDAVKEVRFELIRLLRFEQSNAELLLNLVKTEKGKNKECALRSLGYMDDDRAAEVYGDVVKKKPEIACEYLIASTSESASKIVSRLCMELLPRLLESKEEQELSEADFCKNCSENVKECPFIKTLKYRFCRCVEALIGKSGDAVLECYQTLLADKEQFEFIKDDVQYDIVMHEFDEDYSWLCCRGIRYDTIASGNKNSKKKHSWEQVIGMHLACSLVLRDNPRIADFVMEQYENREGSEKNDSFLTAAAFIKICSDEHCAAWFEEQIGGGIYSTKQFNKQMAIKDAIEYIRWDTARHAYVAEGHIQCCDEGIYEDIKRTVSVPDHSAIMDWMMQAGWDDLVYNWTNKDDAKECARVGEWFYNRFLAKVVPTLSMHTYLVYLKGCRWTKCQGLGEVFGERGQPFDSAYQIQIFFENLPGKKEEAKAEMDIFIKMAEENQIKGIDENGTAYLNKLRDRIF
ncbi:MAG: hypothetical protein K2O91_23100, partial [Lachnospiraceae bacterium]|nr:hypothetical protein [Lachnospiraceae bacterium]